VTSIPGGPPAACVELRCGHTLGHVQDLYCFGGDGGNEYTGRAFCNLCMDSTEFSVLPAHFKRDFQCNWEHILSGFDNLPSNMQMMAPYLVACLVLHKDYLQQTLPVNNKLFQSRLFSHGDITISRDNYVTQLSEHVVVRENRSEHSDMVASGVPPQVHMLRQMKNMATSVDSLTKTVSSLNDTVHEIKMIQPPFRNTPSEVISGSISDSITREELHSQLTLLFDNLKTCFQQRTVTTEDSTTDNTGSNMSNSFGLLVGRQSWSVVDYERLKKLHVGHMWDEWHFGNPRCNNPPLKWCSQPIPSQHKTFHSKVKSVMVELVKIAIQQRMIRKDSDITKDNSSRILQESFTYLLGDDNENYKVQHQACLTIYKKYIRKSHN
jgi:hypothetical protein